MSSASPDRLQITHRISGELYGELCDGTSLDNWGYCATVELDREVERGVKQLATRHKVGFGEQYEMTLSAGAWLGIAEYAKDRCQMEQEMDGDSNRAMGKRLGQQAEKIKSAIILAEGATSV